MQNTCEKSKRLPVFDFRNRYNQLSPSYIVHYNIHQKPLAQLASTDARARAGRALCHVWNRGHIPQPHHFCVTFQYSLKILHTGGKQLLSIIVDVNVLFKWKVHCCFSSLFVTRCYDAVQFEYAHKFRLFMKTTQSQRLHISS